MRLIDADAIYDKIEERYRNSSGLEHRCERDFLDFICDATTVDAVPVVRCGECKHSFVGPCLSCQAGKSVMCGKFHTHMMVKDFCKYGERRKENAVHTGKSD